MFDFKTAEEAFAKEQELVPISETHKHNKQCYNLVEGGIGGELSDSDLLDMKQKIS